MFAINMFVMYFVIVSLLIDTLNHVIRLKRSNHLLNRSILVESCCFRIKASVLIYDRLLISFSNFDRLNSDLSILPSDLKSSLQFVFSPDVKVLVPISISNSHEY
ncbi:hypothetical protein L2E82_45725 [Cichorium intybus]|uniref:Uncharacterized protein n=1 Tax=Cichorium intybus TaxID=13427 RepID=A0ACB8ZU47_CICIN|nr:hypothetical protein L2E82_45725 [Cichorium intybus]